MRISDWSSDVFSSDLVPPTGRRTRPHSRGDLGAALGTRAARRPPPGRAGRPGDPTRLRLPRGEIGRASCRERVCQYVSISVVAVSLNKKTETISIINAVLSTTTHVN